MQRRGLPARTFLDGLCERGLFTRVSISYGPIGFGMTVRGGRRLPTHRLSDHAAMALSWVAWGVFKKPSSHREVEFDGSTKAAGVAILAAPLLPALDRVAGGSTGDRPELPRPPRVTDTRLRHAGLMAVSSRSSATSERCPSCGASAPVAERTLEPKRPASPGCWQLYGEILADLYTTRRLLPLRQLAVDAYAVQHPAPPTRVEIQAIALHLMTLCLFFDDDIDPRHGSVLHQRIMAGRPSFELLTPPHRRGELTVVDAWSVSDANARAEALRRWGQSAWNAWSPHHGIVRAWVDRSGVAGSVRRL